MGWFFSSASVPGHEGTGGVFERLDRIIFKAGRHEEAVPGGSDPVAEAHRRSKFL
jgi:hypothetical protein